MGGGSGLQGWSWILFAKMLPERQMRGSLCSCYCPGILGMNAQLPLTFSSVKAVLSSFPQSPHICSCMCEPNVFSFSCRERKEWNEARCLDAGQEYKGDFPRCLGRVRGPVTWEPGELWQTFVLCWQTKVPLGAHRTMEIESGTYVVCDSMDCVTRLKKIFSSTCPKTHH